MSLNRMKSFLLLTTFVCCVSSAQAKINFGLKNNSSKPVVISGFLFDADSIQFTFWEGANIDFINSRKFVAKYTDSSNFNFKVIPVNGLIKLNFVIFNNGAHRLYYDYVVEAGDSINLIAAIKNGNFSVTFFGKDATKYQLKGLIDQEFEKFDIDRLFVDKSLGEASIKISHAAKVLEPYKTGRLRMLKVLDSHKNHLSPPVYQIMKADLLSLIVYYYHYTLNSFYTRALNNVESNLALKLYSYNKIPLELFSDQVLQLAPRYVEYILERSKLDLLFEYRASGQQVISFKDIYFKLKGNFQGLLREKLLTFFIVNPMFQDPDNTSQSDFDECVEDAFMLIKDPLLKGLIKNILMAYKKGADAYNFSLPDTSGNLVSLHDFKGRVVLIDMWYTGCSGCANFFKIFESEIFPRFKNNPLFKVVSISTDKGRERWLNSINGGRYTQPEHVNLYTNGMGANHPIMKHYDIKAFPALILIDKSGKIFSRVLPGTDSKEIINLFNSAIQEH